MCSVCGEGNVLTFFLWFHRCAMGLIPRFLLASDSLKDGIRRGKGGVGVSKAEQQIHGLNVVISFLPFLKAKSYSGSSSSGVYANTTNFSKTK